MSSWLCSRLRRFFIMGCALVLCTSACTGSLRETEACGPSTCENGGVCMVVGAGFECSCATGFTGLRCEIVEGFCSDNRCENGSTCIENASGFTCDCTPGFRGALCDEVAGPCDDDPCLNGGICQEDGTTFTCQCPFGFSGMRCETGSTPVSGLDVRPSNPDCVAPARVTSSGPVTWEAASFSGLDNNLMMIAQAPDGAWFEIYRGGDVYRLSPTGVRDDSPLLTIPVATDGELGLLGLALHPAFPTEPYVFFFYTTLPSGQNGRIHIDRYTVSPATGGANTVQINPASRREILNVDRGNRATNHAAGTIHFDPLASGAVLYVAMGDAARRNEAQNPGSLLGKILRIDVSDSGSGASYTPEIVGMGLRNPFRWSFDRQTGDMWIGDVGESSFEEVDRIPRAALLAGSTTPVNLGWPIMEGFLCSQGGDPGNSCGNPSPLMLPVHSYGRSLGVSVIGGYVYRGSAINGLSGTYFFHDIFPQGGEPAWRLDVNPSEDPSNLEDDFQRTVLNRGGFVSYAEDRTGELYGVATWGGVFRLEASNQMPVDDPFPANLSEVPCFDATGEPTAAVIPYDLNAPLWSDGASKRRWFAIPDGTHITLTERGDFEFPNGTVLIKEFTQDGVRVETRLMVRHPDGEWRGYTYAWVDDAGNTLTDAELLPDAAVTRDVPGRSAQWTYPSRGQCLTCHTRAAGFSLGLEAGQLNREFTYPATGRSGNQLHTLSEVDLVSSDVTPFSGHVYPRYDSGAETADRAWSYLHSNCAGCHQPGAAGFGGRSNMPDMRYDVLADRSGTHPLAERLCDVEAGSGDLGLGAGALLIAPGTPGDWSNLSAGGSILYLRMAARPNVAGSNGTMPQIGSAQIDTEDGLPLLNNWIRDLSCP